MGYEARVIRDSVSPAGTRLSTLVVEFPRIILAEMNTHRDFSRNSASSRAIPIRKIIQGIKDDPYIPAWTKNQTGMSGEVIVDPAAKEKATDTYLSIMRQSLNHAEYLAEQNIHKQDANRILEPYMWHTAVISATRWNNFFSQRCDLAAHPAMNIIATMMRDALKDSRPIALREGEYHLPFIQDDERDQSLKRLIQMSIARCARVSYLNHEGKRDVASDLELYLKLVTGIGGKPHMSPFEHVSQAVEFSEPHEFGNFDSGWIQARKLFKKEYVH